MPHTYEKVTSGEGSP